MKSKDKFEDTNILRQLVILQRGDLVLPAYIFINDKVLDVNEWVIL